ncbi:MAG: deoxyguanosinetriphosphate triphosphohydrolase family protein [Vampirovibrionia bacterium]
MQKNSFASEGMFEGHRKWKNSISRKKTLYDKMNDHRSEFYRDYCRILHSRAYRRLKFKTQVYFAPENDHTCTRIEHVNHVASVSYVIARQLGLNTELTNAIAIGHDLGHSPFGHTGENLLKELAEENGLKYFGHEKNGLKFIDKIETLTHPTSTEEFYLNLTYAVRDGIVCHCGEAENKPLKAREAFEDLNNFYGGGANEPYTWEGCVVRIADKIAYYGRDLEDSIRYGLITLADVIDYLEQYFQRHNNNITRQRILRATSPGIINLLIDDLLDNSSLEEGLGYSDDVYLLLDGLNSFCYDKIYTHIKIRNYQDYSNLIMKAIFGYLKDLYNPRKTKNKKVDIHRLKAESHLLAKYFIEWLNTYSNMNIEGEDKIYINDIEILYDISSEKDYKQAVLEFISGMTDRFAVRIYKEITAF